MRRGNNKLIKSLVDTGNEFISNTARERLFECGFKENYRWYYNGRTHTQQSILERKIGEDGLAVIDSSGTFVYSRAGTRIRGHCPESKNVRLLVDELIQHSAYLDANKSKRDRKTNFVTINAVARVKAKIKELGCDETISAKQFGHNYYITDNKDSHNGNARNFFKISVRKSKIKEDVALLIDNLEHIIKVYQMSRGKFT